MRHRVIALLAIGSLLPLVACGDDDDDDGERETTETTEAPDTSDAADPNEATDDTGVAGGVDPNVDLLVEGFAFGDVAPVAAGDAVSVANVDGAPHTVTSYDDEWEPVRVEGGGSAELTAPEAAGEYAFHCDIHPTMTGTLVVE